MSKTRASRLAHAFSHRIAPLLLSLAAMACGGSEAGADPDGPPPARELAAGPTGQLPPVPEGFIPRRIVYKERRYDPDYHTSVLSSISIDHRDLPGQPQWRLSSGTPQYGYGTAAHLTSDLRLVSLVDTWGRLVRLRRDGDELIGTRESRGDSDSLRISLPPGAPFHTDLSLHFLLATWPVAPGWEERGMMSEGRSSHRVVPVRIRVVGEETLSTPLGVADCWIVVVHGPRDGRRAPHWYWVSKRDRIVVMRRHYLPDDGGRFEEHLIHEYPTTSHILIDVVTMEPPSFDATPAIAFERAIAPRYHLAARRWEAESLYRFTLRTDPRRQMTSSDSATIARLLDSAGYSGRYRIEPPTDRAFVRLPRAGSPYRAGRDSIHHQR